MDKCSTDAEFDSYWDYEAKNKNRNRIRVGRQYQATIPPLLKPGEKDRRKCEELETLKWKPGQLSDYEIEKYMFVAKHVHSHAEKLINSKSVEKPDIPVQSALIEFAEFLASHYPCFLNDGCCKVRKPSSSGESTSKVQMTNDWSPCEAELFAKAVDACGKNFGAIKKEFFPWKPVKSIIEYYYQGKGERTSPHCLENDPQSSVLVKSEKETPPSLKKEEEQISEIKQDEEPIPSCSYDEKPSVAKIEVPEQSSSAAELETETKNDSVNFLENTRATETCQENTDVKMSVPDEENNSASSTIGSLKFFLGGRLVLKLNAQQDSGSGTKCQWVQSNDLPKHSNSTKKVKHKKKVIQDFVASPDTPQKKKKTEELTVSHKMSDYSLSAVRKPRLKSEYEFSESDKQGMLLCSSSWTPPVADGQESVDVDDASSKTSEGYISPVLSNSRTNKGDTRGDHACNLNSTHEMSEKNESDQCTVKFSNVQSENFTDDSASKNLCFIGGKNSPSQYADDLLLKQEVLNHKSALTHNKFQVKSPCYQSRSSHSSSPLVKQWNKWSNMPYPVKTSPCSLSPVSVVDSKSPVKEIPLDLSSKLENETSNMCGESAMYKNCTNPECQDKCMASECESGPASSEFSPPSSSLGSHPRSLESPKKDFKNNSFKCSSNSNADQQILADALKKENAYSCTKISGDSNQIAYTYCNLPYPCASPKCTKDYSLEEHACNKSNPENMQETCPGYVVQEVVDGMYKKNSDWCRNTCVPIPQCYPQCYPSYYIAYDVTPSPGSESSGADMPLDLSSASENPKDKSTVPEKLTEDVNDVSKINTDDVERGMLYQLLKNKTSK